MIQVVSVNIEVSNVLTHLLLGAFMGHLLEDVPPEEVEYRRVVEKNVLELCRAFHELNSSEELVKFRTRLIGFINLDNMEKKDFLITAINKLLPDE